MNSITTPFCIKSLNDQGVFSGYASVYGFLDQHGDRVMWGAFRLSLEKVRIAENVNGECGVREWSY